MSQTILEAIVVRTRRHVERQRRRYRPRAEAHPERGPRALQALARTRSLPNVIAEVKFRSPSAGRIRARRTGEAVRVAREYARGGAAAISVLADGPGFGGGIADVRRVASVVKQPVLFKGFVVDPFQVQIAADVGASLVLLLASVLDDDTLAMLIGECRRLGLEPVLEVADEGELRRALKTDARIIGVNARDLHTFRVDPVAAARCVEAIPSERLAVYMSGVRSREDLIELARGRADAALVGEGLMRHSNPGDVLAEWVK